MIPRLLVIYCNARPGHTHGGQTFALRMDALGKLWLCDRCGARVKVAW